METVEPNNSAEERLTSLNDVVPDLLSISDDSDLEERDDVDSTEYSEFANLLFAALRNENWDEDELPPAENSPTPHLEKPKWYFLHYIT